MCVVSMVGDHFSQKWNQPPYQGYINNIFDVSRFEFEALKKEVQDMKELLIKAKIYDEKHNEPNCELESKMVLLRKMAELVGINLDEVLNDRKNNNSDDPNRQ